MDIPKLLYLDAINSLFNLHHDNQVILRQQFLQPLMSFCLVLPFGLPSSPKFFGKKWWRSLKGCCIKDIVLTIINPLFSSPTLSISLIITSSLVETGKLEMLKSIKQLSLFLGFFIFKV